MAIASFSILTAKRAFFLLLAAIYLLPPSALATDVSYSDSKANYVVKVGGLKITLNLVKAGKPALFAISTTTALAVYLLANLCQSTKWSYDYFRNHVFCFYAMDVYPDLTELG
ncbi:hypothetical protein LINPERPRIM_LOCUS21638 [Linum perenne]